MKEIMEKLNKNEEKKVSGGGAAIYSSNGNRFKGADGEDFGVFCDCCGCAIEGKAGAIRDSKGNIYCLYCANQKIDLLKKMEINEKFSTMDGLKYTFEN
ncbi:MAG: hypothetical protein Q4B93_03010 [Clostridia bacterium]|nr:hypothetical protein [Clostridia bacterium]